MTITQYPSDQSVEAVLVSAAERVAGHTFGIGEPVEEIRYLDEVEDMRDAIAWEEAWREWEDRDFPW